MERAGASDSSGSKTTRWQRTRTAKCRNRSSRPTGLCKCTCVSCVVHVSLCCVGAGCEVHVGCCHACACTVSTTQRRGRKVHRRRTRTRTHPCRKKHPSRFLGTPHHSTHRTLTRVCTARRTHTLVHIIRLLRVYESFTTSVCTRVCISSDRRVVMHCAMST